VALTIPAFLIIYFNAYWRRSWELVPTLIAFAVLGTLWAPFNLGASVFFIFACSFAGWIGHVQRAAFAVAAIQAWVGIVALSLQPHVGFWLPACVFGTMASLICIFDSSRVRRAAAL